MVRMMAADVGMCAAPCAGPGGVEARHVSVAGVMTVDAHLYGLLLLPHILRMGRHDLAPTL